MDLEPSVGESGVPGLRLASGSALARCGTQPGEWLEEPELLETCEHKPQLWDFLDFTIRDRRTEAIRPRDGAGAWPRGFSPCVSVDLGCHVAQGPVYRAVIKPQARVQKIIDHTRASREPQSRFFASLDIAGIGCGHVEKQMRLLTYSKTQRRERLRLC